MPVRRETPAQFGLSYNQEEGMVSVSLQKGCSFSPSDLETAWSYAEICLEETQEEMDFFGETEENPKAYLLECYDKNRKHNPAEEVKYQLLVHDKLEESV